MQKTILFGASKLGTLAYEYLKDRHDIYYYCDNDINKVGKKLNGLEIISAKKLMDLVINQDYSVIITSQYYKEISNQLISQGIDKKDFKIFYNSLEYLQTLYDIEDKKDDMKSLVNYSDAKYNKDIFSKYNVHLMMDNIYTKTFIETINKEYDSKSNLFIIYNRGEKIKYADVDMYENVEIVDLDDYSIYFKLYTYIYGCNKLFVHYLSDDICKILDRFDLSRLSCTTYWILWGADLYNYIDFNMYEEKTYEFIKDKDYFINAQRYRKDPKKLEIRKNVIKKTNYILTSNKVDYQLVLENFNTEAMRKNFRYKMNIDFCMLEEIKRNGKLYLKKQSGFDFLFLVGNSATLENNHVDVFYKLIDLNLQNFGIVLPLSYGNKNYAKDVVIKGKKMLGDKLIILEKYLNINEYYSIINQVDVVIMNHIRQQAVGNIFGAIYLGKQVYLNKKSNLYEMFNEEGLEIHDLEDLCEEKIMSGNSVSTDLKIDIIKKRFKNDYSIILQ